MGGSSRLDRVALEQRQSRQQHWRRIQHHWIDADELHWRWWREWIGSRREGIRLARSGRSVPYPSRISTMARPRNVSESNGSQPRRTSLEIVVASRRSSCFVERCPSWSRIVRARYRSTRLPRSRRLLDEQRSNFLLRQILSYGHQRVDASSSLFRSSIQLETLVAFLVGLARSNLDASSQLLQLHSHSPYIISSARLLVVAGVLPADELSPRSSFEPRRWNRRRRRDTLLEESGASSLAQARREEEEKGDEGVVRRVEGSFAGGSRDEGFEVGDPEQGLVDEPSFSSVSRTRLFLLFDLELTFRSFQRASSPQTAVDYINQIKNTSEAKDRELEALRHELSIFRSSSSSQPSHAPSDDRPTSRLPSSSSSQQDHHPSFPPPHNNHSLHQQHYPPPPHSHHLQGPPPSFGPPPGSYNPGSYSIGSGPGGNYQPPPQSSIRSSYPPVPSPSEQMDARRG